MIAKTLPKPRMMNSVNRNIFTLDWIDNNSIRVIIDLRAAHSTLQWLLLLKHLPIITDWLHFDVRWID